MTRHRFIVAINSGELKAKTLNITDLRQIHQIRKVLRLKQSNYLDLIDGKGALLHCQITDITSERIEVKVLESQEELLESQLVVTLACAILKNEKFDLLIQKLTELGVDEIIPIYTNRTVVKEKVGKNEEKGSGKKFARWMSISREATEQSERLILPRISQPLTLEQYLTSASEKQASNLRFICAARVEAPPLVELLAKHFEPGASHLVPPSHIHILVGPEGGFTQSEIDNAIESGYVPVKLGKTILRSETAAIAAATLAASFGEFS